MKIIEYIGKKTLIVIDEIYLVEQWRDYLLTNTNLTEDKLLCLTGKLTKEDKKKIECIESMDVVVATKNTLINKPDLIHRLDKVIGLLCVDEAHCCAAKIFTDVISGMSTKWTLGLTASPNRDDGLLFLVVNNCGHILYTGTIYDSANLGSSIIPELRIMFLKKKIPYPIRQGESYHKTAERILKDSKVIDQICKVIKSHYLLNDSQLCITQKVEESKELMDTLINKHGIKAEEICVVLGETKLEERIELIEAIKKGEIKIVISSKIFDKGVSANNLNVLHNIYPCKASANTIQRCGKLNQFCLIYKKAN